MNNSLIYQVFKTMEYGQEEAHNTIQAQLWVRDHRNIVNPIKCNISTLVKKEALVDIYNRQLNLKSLAKIVIMKKEFIADVFLELSPIYSRSYLMRLIEELIQHIKYFAQIAVLEYKHEQSFVKSSLLVRCQSLPLKCISSYLIPALAKGYTAEFMTNKTNNLYFQMFIQLCKEAGCPEMTKILDLGMNETDQCSKHSTVQNVYPRIEVKMLVFEDADLHSAVDCVVDAIWNMSEKAPYLLTNVFVQESVSSEFSRMLKVRMLEHTDRPVRYIATEDGTYYSEALNEYKSIVENGSTVDAFQVGEFESAMPPTVLFNSKFETSSNFFLPIVCVDVFRTETEVQTMSNNSIGQAASIWTESGSLAHRIAKALSVDTVWTNGYDLVHPITSHLSSPLDSVYRSEEEYKPITLNNPNTSCDLSLGAEVQKSWKCASSVVLNWMNDDRCEQILADACNNIITSGNNKFECLKEIFSVWGAVPALTDKLLSTVAFNIEVMTRPRGIICIELAEDLSLADSVYAITAAVAFKNCALISAPAHLYQDLLEWSQFCKFPIGVINIFKQCHADCVSPVDRFPVSLASVKFALWSFNENSFCEMEFTKLLSKFSIFCQDIECTRIKHVQKLSVDQIKQMSTRPKFVWIPNQ